MAPSSEYENVRNINSNLNKVFSQCFLLDNQIRQMKINKVI